MRTQDFQALTDKDGGSIRLFITHDTEDYDFDPWYERLMVWDESALSLRSGPAVSCV
ncbi:MAG: hypothetical protein R3C40_07715 [Parvularculaceae bacterium]